MLHHSRRKIIGVSIAGAALATAAGTGVAMAVGGTGGTPVQAETYTMTIGSSGVSYTFTSCSSFGSKTDVVYAKTADGSTVITAGANHFDNVVCTRPASSDLALQSWRDLVTSGRMQAARQNVSISTFDSTGKRSALWTLTNAWPSELHDTPKGSGMTESITFTMDSQARNTP